MKRTASILMAALICLPALVNAQTERTTSNGSQGRENPRGIYKMTTLTGKLGEVKAPLHQYKICTDSVTLMVAERDAFFSISNNDHQVFNYTGDQPKKEGDKSPLIYDSNDKQFILKWWSTYTNHIHFPKNDWCLEKYESGKYSETSKVFFDALTGKVEMDEQNPLTGTWRIFGYVDELRDVKRELPRLHEQYPNSKYFNCFMVLGSKDMVMLAVNGGGVDKITYNGKKSYKVGTMTHLVKWLSKDRIAVAEHIDYRIDWMIMERVTDGSTPLSHIASQYVRASK